jgi:hypothetical protein
MTDKKSGEFWANRVRVFSAQPERLLRESDWRKPLPNVYGLEGRMKSRFEITALQATLLGVNQFRRATCFLPDEAFSLKRLHILSEQECASSIGGPTIGGKCVLGHVFVRDNFDPEIFIAILCHELLHALSYYWIDIRPKSIVTADGLKIPFFLQRRHGMLLIDPSFGTMLPHFHGLNEYATEHAAIVVRNVIARKTQLLDEGQKKILRSFVSSPPLLQFFSDLITMAVPNEKQQAAFHCVLYADYFQGTDNFLQMLEKDIPGVTEVLRRTGAKPAELFKAAEELGMTKTAEFISQHIK